MIIIVAVIAGAALGYNTARKRGGNGKDKAQHAAAYALLFAVGGVFLTILVERIAG